MAPFIHLAQRGEDIVDIGSSFAEFVESMSEDIEPRDSRSVKIYRAAPQTSLKNILDKENSDSES